MYLKISGLDKISKLLISIYCCICIIFFSSRIDQSKQHSEEMDVSYDENIIPGPVGVEHEGNCVETQTDGSYTSVEVQTAGMCESSSTCILTCQ